MKYSSIKKRILALVLAMAVASPNAMTVQASGNTEVPEEITAFCDDKTQIIESEEGLASVSGVVSEEVLEEVEKTEAKSKARTTAAEDTEGEVEEVEKLPCTLEYKSQIVEYGSEFEFELTSDPEDIQTINFIAGIDFSDAAEGSQTYVNVQIPGDVGSLLEGEYTLAEFRDMLELAAGLGVVDNMMNSLGFGSFKIDLSTVVQLMKIMEKIQLAAGTNETIITIGGEYHPENVGVYIAGAITADSAYETAFTVGYLIVVPAGERVDLAYDMETENNIVARQFLVDGTFSLNASAYQDGVKNEEATAEISHLFVGINSDGEFEVLNTAAGDDMLAQNGVWAQLSFTAEWDNMKYYSIPIGRAFKVTSEAVDVKLVNMDGLEANYQLSVYDGTGKSMSAVVYDKDGQQISQDMVDEYINFKYIGYALSAPDDIYMSNEMPTDAGIYSVIAVYGEDEAVVENPRFGMTVGAIIIAQADSELSVASKAHTYDKKKVNVKKLLTVNPEEADVAILTATLSQTTNVDDINIANVTESINIDFPTNVDNLLKAYMNNIYTDGISSAEYIEQYQTIKGILQTVGVDTEGMDKIVELLQKFPLSLKVTFKEQTKVNPANEGIYLVAAAVCDPNYAASFGIGTVLVSSYAGSENTISIEVEEDKIFEYDGESHTLAVTVKDKDGNVLTDEEVKDNLTVKHLGLSAESGFYNKEEAPTELGVYSVIAMYKDLNENGDLVGLDISVGNMLIGGKEIPLEAKDTEVFYDGTGKTVELENAENCELIQVFVDESEKANINVILPESWEIENQVINVGTSFESGLNQLKELIEILPDNDKINVEDITAVSEILERLFEDFCPVQTITINGELPTEIGSYQVLVLAYGEDYTYGADTAILTIKERDYIVESVTASATKALYNGETFIPEITVTDTYSEQLVEGTDYTVAVYNSKGEAVDSPKAADEYTIKVTFTGNFASNEEQNLTYSILPVVESVKASVEKTLYNGKTFIPVITATDTCGNKLVEETDYIVTVYNSKGEAVDSPKAVGKYTIKVTFTGSYADNAEQSFTYSILPKAVTNLKASLVPTNGYNSVKVTWTKSTGATGYYVYYKKNTAASYTTSNRKAVTGNTVTFKNLAGGTKYNFKVVPYFGTDKITSTKFTTVSKTTLKKVVGVKATRTGKKVKVSWTNLNGETGYQVSRAAKKTGTANIKTYAGENLKTKTITLPAAKKYYYKVRAYKVENGKKVFGPWSAVVYK